MNSALVPFTCLVKEHSVFLRELKIFDSKAYDLSSLTIIEMSKNFSSYAFKFWNTILKPYDKVQGNLGLSTGIF